MSRTAGTPTLTEFIFLCQMLGYVPSSVMRLIEEQVEGRPENYDDLVDLVIANPEMFDIAALHDDKKNIERDTPRD